MSLIRFQKTSHNKSELKLCTKVDQGRVKCSFFSSEDKETPLLWTEGMNPCTGTIIYGKAEIVKKNSQESSTVEGAATLGSTEGRAPQETLTVTESFVAMLHDEGARTMTKQSSNEAVEKYCRESIQSIFSQIEEEASHSDYIMKKIELNKSFFIRCIPDEKDNIQNKVSAAFKLLLASQNIKEIAKETEMDVSSISVKEDYGVECIEELEKLAEKDSSDMHCYIKSGASGELEIIYEHAAPLSEKLTTSTDKEEQEENDEEEDDEEEKIEKMHTKRKLGPSSSSSSSFSQSSPSVYSSSSSTLFSTTPSSASSLSTAHTAGPVSLSSGTDTDEQEKNKKSKADTVAQSQKQGV